MKQYDLLNEVLLYEFQKQNYTPKEQELLKKHLLKKCKQKLLELEVSFEWITND